jgi:ATP-binding cassette subfamily B multidrug efflux pump
MNKAGVYRRLFGYLKPYWQQVIIAYVAMVVVTLLKLFVPQIIKNAIDNGLATGKATALFMAGGIILGLAVILGLGAFSMMYNGLWLTHRVAYDLRKNFYDAVQSLPFAFHDRAQTGDLMSRATGDITETERFVGIGLRDLLATILLLTGVVIAMLLEDLTLAALALIPIPLLVFAAIRFGSVMRPMFKSIQEQMGVLATTMQESMTGIGVVKAFAREPYELRKFDRENDIWFERRYRVIKSWGNNWPFFTFTLAISIFLLLQFGGPKAIAGEITIGSLFAMISYVLMLNGPVQRIGFLINLASTAAASATRVFEILDTPNTIADPPGAIDLTNMRGQVTFEHVNFAYQGKLNVLQDITFTAEAGQTIALMGPTGSGKSTITNLIPRFYDPTEGQVLIDGIDIRQLKLKNLRREIGIVLQDPFLFGSTIAENIAYGRPDAIQETITAAAKAARAHDFIMEFPNGYDTLVGERGVTLSGGQKQRIAIARALLCDPTILILDDSTSSVDTETEHLIQQALAVLMEGRTTFIIAQRLLTLKNADMILVLDKGRIVERGTHEALLANKGLYRQIYDLQLKDQEEFTALQTTNK